MNIFTNFNTDTFLSIAIILALMGLGFIFGYAKGYDKVIKLKLGELYQVDINSFLWPKEEILDSLLQIRTIYTEQGELIINQPLPKHFDYHEDQKVLCVNIMHDRIRVFKAYPDSMDNIMLSEYKDFEFKNSTYSEIYETLQRRVRFDYLISDSDKVFVNTVMNKIKNKVQGTKEQYQNINIRNALLK